MKIASITSENREIAESFLKRHEESSQFLINNLAEYGPRLTAHHNSGNFKMLLDGDSVKAVFVLARRGNLLAQAEGDFASQILDACEQESIKLEGFIGHEESVLPIAKLFREKNPEFQPTFESREILYRYEWLPHQAPSKHDSRVRSLTEHDYSQYAPRSQAYMREFGLPDQVDEEVHRKEFARQCGKKLQWALFQGNELISKAVLNSTGPKIGQVGGVYTVPEQRRQGLSKAVMLHLLEDCRQVHGHTKNILFTGTADVPAQKLYESIGYERIGYFTILFVT